MPSIFIRSVHAVGDGGLFVTLPISWARYCGLKPGDKVEVIADGELVIRPLPKGGARAEKARTHKG